MDENLNEKELVEELIIKIEEALKKIQIAVSHLEDTVNSIFP